MSKLSRDERIGASLLALVVFLVVASAFVLRECAARRDTAPPQVEIIYQAPDSVADTGMTHGKKDKTGKKDKKKAAKRESAKQKKKNKSDKKSEPGKARDLLSEPVPTK